MVTYIVSTSSLYNSSRTVNPAQTNRQTNVKYFYCVERKAFLLHKTFLLRDLISATVLIFIGQLHLAKLSWTVNLLWCLSPTRVGRCQPSLFSIIIEYDATKDYSPIIRSLVYINVHNAIKCQITNIGLSFLTKQERSESVPRSREECPPQIPQIA